MANTNAQAVAFVNSKVRVLADLMYSNYLSCKSIVSQWNAQSVSSVIPNDTTVIADGAATDGRPQITNAQATAIITRAQEVITDYEAASNAKLNSVVAPAVNGVSRV